MRGGGTWWVIGMTGGYEDEVVTVVVEEVRSARMCEVEELARGKAEEK
jgi:hypothetical protein